VIRSEIDGSVFDLQSGGLDQLPSASIVGNQLKTPQGNFNLEKIHTQDAHMNAGIYRVSLPGGDPGILKVLTSNAQALDEIQGSVLGAEVGGPQIYHVGRVDLGSGRPSNVYVEMEELFPGQKVTLLKQDARVLALHDSNHVSVSKKLGSMLETAFEHHIQIADMDAMVSHSGQIRWVDTQEWKLLNCAPPVRQPSQSY
jgi:hypothetical protein